MDFAHFLRRLPDQQYPDAEKVVLVLDNLSTHTPAALDCGGRTVARVRKAFAEGGLDAAVHRKKPTGRRFRMLDGEQDAKLVALACSAPPEGKARWTLQLLAGRLVELRVVGAVSDETVRRTLKKMTSSRGSSSSG